MVGITADHNTILKFSAKESTRCCDFCSSVRRFFLLLPVFCRVRVLCLQFTFVLAVGRMLNLFFRSVLCLCFTGIGFGLVDPTWCLLVCFDPMPRWCDTLFYCELVINGMDGLLSGEFVFLWFIITVPLSYCYGESYENICFVQF